MDKLWIWLQFNPWAFWLPAAAVAIAALSLLINRKSRSLRTHVSLRTWPWWAWPGALMALLLIPLFTFDRIALAFMLEFFLPSQDSWGYIVGPVWLQAAIFSVIGIPIILQGLAFGWLRRLFTSSVHCPKCNYDLASLIKRSGEHNTTCPECGFKPTPETPIGRPQKSRRLIIAGSLLVLLGLSLSSYRLWKVHNQPIPTWITKLYTNITGDLSAWSNDPFQLSETLTLKQFDQSITFVKFNGYNIDHMLGTAKAVDFYTHSRDLDIKLNDTFAVADPPQQVALFVGLRRYLNFSAQSPHRSAAVAKAPLPLDAAIDLFITPKGDIRKDLDPAKLLTTYNTPATPQLIKSAIISIAGQFDPQSLAVPIVLTEKDPAIKAAIVDRLLTNFGITEIIIQLSNPAVPDTLHLWLMDYLLKSPYWSRPTPSSPWPAAVESRVLRSLEQSPLLWTVQPRGTAALQSHRWLAEALVPWFELRAAIASEPSFKPRWLTLKDRGLARLTELHAPPPTPLAPITAP